MFVFVYSSYHLKLSFPHLETQHSTFKTPENIFCFNNNIMQNDNSARIHGHYHESSDCFEYPKKSLLKSSHPKNTCQIFLCKEIPESKISNPKKSFNHPLSLEIPSTPPGYFVKFNFHYFKSACCDSKFNNKLDNCAIFSKLTHVPLWKVEF